MNRSLFPATAQDVAAALQAHIGALNGVRAEDLAAQLHLPVRQLRDHITALRAEGMAVCGKPESGYYIAANAEELEETCQFLRSRALHSLHLEARLRRITLPDLLGQLKLRT